MKYIVTFDFGTTAVKCAVLNENQKVVFFKEKEIRTYVDGLFIEQNPDEWYEVFIELSQNIFSQNIKNTDILGIVCSGQMQDLIFMDESGCSLCNAILYNDQRGVSETDKISEHIKNSIKRKTSNELNGSIPLVKLLWVKNNKPDLYTKTYKLLFSPKDCIITKLTGNFVSDVTTLSTCGIMDINEKKYVNDIEMLGLDKSMLPKICYADEIAGIVAKKAAQNTGFMEGTKVYAGSGDAGATTLASGISERGEININLGTSGWVASLSDVQLKNVFNLSAVNRGLYINVIPILNAGNVHKWIAKIFDDKTINKYDLLHDEIEKSPPSSCGLFFLPYIVGERFPVSDGNIRGCYIGINANTSKSDIIRSTLEGVAFSVRQCLAALDIKPKKISLIGGGAKDSNWNQIFADILGTDIIVYENSEFLPSMALASIVMLEQGIINSYMEFVSKLIENTEATVYKANAKNVEIYNKAYLKFLKIYPAVKNLF